MAKRLCDFCEERPGEWTCKECDQIAWCSSECRDDHWHLGGHDKDCALLGDALHPENLEEFDVFDEEHKTVLLEEALERGLLEAAKNPLERDEFLEIGNQIADAIFLRDAEEIDEELSSQALDWLHAHEHGPDASHVIKSDTDLLLALAEQMDDSVVDLEKEVSSGNGDMRRVGGLIQTHVTERDVYEILHAEWTKNNGLISQENREWGFALLEAKTRARRNRKRPQKAKAKKKKRSKSKKPKKTAKTSARVEKQKAKTAKRRLARKEKKASKKTTGAVAKSKKTAQKKKADRSEKREKRKQTKAKQRAAKKREKKQPATAAEKRDRDLAKRRKQRSRRDEPERRVIDRSRSTTVVFNRPSQGGSGGGGFTSPGYSQGPGFAPAPAPQVYASPSPVVAPATVVAPSLPAPRDPVRDLRVNIALGRAQINSAKNTYATLLASGPSALLVAAGARVSRLLSKQVVDEMQLLTLLVQTGSLSAQQQQQQVVDNLNQEQAAWEAEVVTSL